MSNLEEPLCYKSKEEQSPLLSLPDDVALGCLTRVSRSDHAALSLFSKSCCYPRVIAIQRKKTNFKPMCDSEEPPYKKSKEEPSPLSTLPDDVALSCLARVSRWDYAALSLLSKSYRSLMASPELYQMRSLTGRTESYVYVCLRTPPVPNPRWYILRRRKISSDLIPIPSFPSQSREGSSVVALDSAIYVIGGLIKGKPISDVLLLDCRTHTWRHIPSMGVARAYPAAAVVEGKIYVVGGCKFKDYSLSWGEVFDPKTQTWGSLPPIPFRKRRQMYIHDCVVRDGKVYAVDGAERTTYYSPGDGKWGIGNLGEVTGARRDWCMIDNLLYSLSKHGRIFWCEQEELDWRQPEGMHWWKEVKGLEVLNENLSRSRLVHFGVQNVEIYNRAKLEFDEIPELAVLLPGARLSNSGGNILLFWDEMIGNLQQIWCAEVSLERRQGGEIWGNIEWSHAVMTVDVDPFLDRYKVLHSVSVTL
ncbi:hypothetical protein EUTSA_v10004132mg [Eutrema salsugineum]|uniref:F-box domain-containing protein n=1 Tax=Eutrema salsugineum TaxID=72664 RepID=V4KM57_EUTSA|nr:putative F-box/kelch-repeat protein At3g24610 [Eutrema salsugineum]ESQ32344.1 hypothetical protein EUTSA_v10004132mg [Eutrema salsugineum]